MSELEIKNSGAEVSRDTSLNLDTLFQASKKENKVVEPTVVGTPELIQPAKSPLEEALEKQQNGELYGASIDAKEYEDSLKAPELKHLVDSDERIAEMDARADESELTLLKRTKMVILKQFETQEDFADAMYELETAVEISEDGSVKISTPEGYDGEAKPLTWWRVRTTEDPEYTIENLKKGLPDPALVRPEMVQEAVEESESVDPENVVETVNDFDEVTDEKIKLVQIIMDKSSMGEVEFSAEEREKLEIADIIQLKQVETVDIEAIRSAKTEVSFSSAVSGYQADGATMVVCFPASGFKAEMTPLAYGEVTDLTLEPELAVTPEVYLKRLSVIYNHMVNPSCGKFESFEDFLSKFAYTDINMAIYGLLCVTYPENQSAFVDCGNKGCKKSFPWKYTLKSLLDLKHCDETFLKKLSGILSATPENYEELAAKSAVRNVLAVKLPDSGIIAEVGIVSAGTFVNNFVAIADEEAIKQAFGDNPSRFYIYGILLLLGISAMHIPTKDGGYVHATTSQEILDTIYKLVKPNESVLLSNLVTEASKGYQAVFGLSDVECPNCHTKTAHVDMDIDDMAFRLYQQLQEADLDVKALFQK